jgi:hypothetical protein
MAIDNEAILAALFARLSTVAILGTASLKTRRYVHWDDVPAGNQPALLVLDRGGTADRQFATPTQWTLVAEVIFYLREPNDKTLTVETDMHTALKQVDAALQRQPGEVLIDEDPGTTLGTNAAGGPMVFRCFRRTYICHRMSQEQAAVSMHIEMVAPE